MQIFSTFGHTPEGMCYILQSFSGGPGQDVFLS